jgi:hypothetical protein
VSKEADEGFRCAQANLGGCILKSGGSIAMTHPNGDQLMEALAELRILFPDWRMGQLVANLAMAAGQDGAVWEVEDEQLLVAARRLIARNRSRQVNPLGWTSIPAQGVAPDLRTPSPSD